MIKTIKGFRLDKELVKELKLRSKEKRLPESELVRQALRHYLNLKKCPTCFRKMQ